MNRRDQGFTMLEMLVVIAILGIIMSFATFSYQGWLARSELDRAVSLITTEIETTRSAARKGTVVSVTATAGGTSITSRGRIQTLPTAKTTGAMNLTFQPPFGTIQTPSGAAAPTLPVSVVVQSTRRPNLSRTISVVSLMGKVVVQ